MPFPLPTSALGRIDAWLQHDAPGCSSDAGKEPGGARQAEHGLPNHGSRSWLLLLTPPFLNFTKALEVWITAAVRRGVYVLGSHLRH